ncbi:hypothetical protein [Paraburkholderia tropica]|uniref:hypothetical protein n=1 Tax=Paraburkholderia tropica TaxID=92647 RepID=UPI002AB0C100|nr:hypothetical protein [Paraburkholderia tropica]
MPGTALRRSAVRPDSPGNPEICGVNADGGSWAGTVAGMTVALFERTAAGYPCQCNWWVLQLSVKAVRIAESGFVSCFLPDTIALAEKAGTLTNDAGALYSTSLAGPGNDPEII